MRPEPICRRASAPSGRSADVPPPLLALMLNYADVMKVSDDFKASVLAALRLRTVLPQLAHATRSKGAEVMPPQAIFHALLFKTGRGTCHFEARESKAAWL